MARLTGQILSGRLTGVARRPSSSFCCLALLLGTSPLVLSNVDYYIPSPSLHKKEKSKVTSHGYRPAIDEASRCQRVWWRYVRGNPSPHSLSTDSVYEDEISALVLDPGYSTTRAGFAGEDVPKSIVPSYYGLIPSEFTPKHAKQLFGDNSINIPLPKISISNVMSKEGTVEDWDTAANLWEYAITSRLTNTKPTPLASNGLNDHNEDTAMEAVEEQEKPLAENPLLLTETGWNAGKDREKGIEIAMENWGCPAFWLARNGVLAAFVFLLSSPNGTAKKYQLRLW